jgi:glycosyltransferase involved in cell wall biosynthesis
MKILVIAHAHPDFSLGGGEIAAYTLYKEYQKSDGVDAYFLGRIDKGQGATGAISLRHINDYLWEQSTVNLTKMTPVNQQSVAEEFSNFITHLQPDVVHLHHYINLGLEIILTIKKISPKTKIILTLHEFVAICENNGQMIKTNGKQLCERSTPDDCARCYPGRTPHEFWLRKENYINHFKIVDYFISPSHFLLERYEEWGIPRNKICFIENGHNHPPRLPARKIKKGETRNRFGFFGQLNQFKGILLVLEALNTAVSPPNIIIEINGANLEIQEMAFQERMLELISDLTRKNIVVNNGPYNQNNIDSRMSNIDWVIVPSIWWENSPMVIQEAFSYARPVICSNIGGMKEKVTHMENGLHVRVNDKNHWLSSLLFACNSEIWNICSQNIKKPPSYSSVTKDHLKLIDQL